MSTQRARPAHGFTLIELMVVVVVIAILAAIVFPNYTEHVRKTRRAEGKSAIAEAANRLERCYTRFNAYNAADCVGAGAITSQNGWYAVSVAAAANSFTLTAEPQGLQSADKCGSFTLTHTGVRGTSLTPPSGTMCW